MIPRFYIVLVLLFLPQPAFAQRDITSGPHPISLLLLFAALSIAPFVFVMTTSFVRFSVVLSILRSAIGTPQIPPTLVITGLSLILTLYVMAPTGAKISEAIQPLIQNHPPEKLFSSSNVSTIFEAALRAKEPIRDFLIKHSSPKDRWMFSKLRKRMQPKALDKSATEKDLMVLIPAFVIGELSAAFRIGFLLFIPFLVIDMVIANILLALGMHMLSPTTISLPFKLLLFVLVDGWALITQGLILSTVS